MGISDTINKKFNFLELIDSTKTIKSKIKNQSLLITQPGVELLLIQGKLMYNEKRLQKKKNWLHRNFPKSIGVFNRLCFIFQLLKNHKQ
jgi:hypothetical protein